MNINMRYWTARLWENSVVSITQNEAWSTVYLISWFVQVSNLSDRSTVLAPWQKITVLRQDATSNDIDLSLLKEATDDYFKSSDWFIKNAPESNLEKNTNSDNTSSSTWKTNTTEPISFLNLSDESSVKSSSIDINWKLNLDSVSNLTLNWLQASLDRENKSFSFKSFSLENKINDLVFKVYDKDKNLIKKYIYTIYYDSWVDNTTASNTFQVTNFEIDASGFKFSSPDSSWTYTTYDNFVTIRWITPVKTVSKVSVNGYSLKSFNWTSWRYHARVDYNNLKNGTNLYEIKYYWDKGKLIYTNYYTIIKKVKQANKQKPTWNNTNKQKIISDEAKVN